MWIITMSCVLTFLGQHLIHFLLTFYLWLNFSIFLVFARQVHFVRLVSTELFRNFRTQESLSNRPKQFYPKKYSNQFVTIIISVIIMNAPTVPTSRVYVDKFLWVFPRTKIMFFSMEKYIQWSTKKYRCPEV